MREVVTSSREGGASLNILSGLVAGNFSAYWLGMAIMVLMGDRLLASARWASATSDDRAGGLRVRPRRVRLPRHGPGDDRRRLATARSPTTRSRSTSCRRSSRSRTSRPRLKKDFGFDVDFEKAKHNLEENDGAGNTFKATAKPVLIGTAVVGATTMIFSIIVALTDGLQPELVAKLSILHPPFLLGLITGGAMIYWFTGASIQAVTTGAYRAVEFIKANIKLEGVDQGVGRGLEEGRRRSARSTRRRACSTSS